MRVLSLLFLAALAGTLVLAEDYPTDSSWETSEESLDSQLEERPRYPEKNDIPGTVDDRNGFMRFPVMQPMIPVTTTRPPIVRKKKKKFFSFLFQAFKNSAKKLLKDTVQGVATSMMQDKYKNQNQGVPPNSYYQ